MTRFSFSAALIAVLFSIPVTTATATPVATSDEQYSVLGRVFPDPLAGCQRAGEQGAPCSPNAKGNVPATQFIQFTEQEFLGGLRYMNQEWSDYMEVWALDGKVGDGSAADPAPADVFPGNSLPLEFEPDADFQSAGLPTSRLERDRSDLVVVRVTDESVSDVGKKRYALALSIHGIERAGAEGGTRAIEDLVSAHATGAHDDGILPADVVPDAPTFAEVLKKTIIYFTYPNPDGWRRGTVFNTDLDQGPGVFFQRYNGNGVDPNRDWPDIGYSYRGYSGMSEPETRAFASFYDDVRQHGEFAAGDDLHGMAGADALSYTMLPHGRHDFGKDHRLRETAEMIHHVSEKLLSWSPAIQPNDSPEPQCVPLFITDYCAPIYGQTWGTVYDTINYTTAGTLGDWYDSRAGLNGDGLANEMAFSHLDRNIVFDPHTEQLHVDGNKTLIYAHLAAILDPPTARFGARGDSKGFVPSPRLTRAEQVNQPEDSGFAQAPMEVVATPQTGTRTVIPFPDKVVPGNGGMRVEVTLANAQGIAPSYTVVGNQVRLRVECKGCDDHHGPPDGTGTNAEWIVVAEDFNQKQLYMASGLIATVNRPEGSTDTHPVDWRLVVTGVHGATKGKITFTRGPASADGNRAGDNPDFVGDEAPRLAAYDVANTDFFDDLEEFDSNDSQYDRIDPRAVIGGTQSLAGLDTLVLADDPLPGYTGPYGTGRPSTPRDPIAISGEPTLPDAYGFEGVQFRIPGVTATQHDFEIAPTEAFRSVKVRIDWTSITDPAVHDTSYDQDFDMFLYRVQGGEEILVGQSAGIGGQTNWEEIVVQDPLPGSYRLYVDNWAAYDYRWQGEISFQHYEPAAGGGGDVGNTGAYTVAEKDAWMGRLREFVQSGGNLVLTDGALAALPDLTTLAPNTVTKRSVYVGQVTFSNGATDTTGQPLAQGVEQPGARFNTGMRRQTYESTPLGFAIQNVAGSDEANAAQWDVDAEAWQNAGGRFDGASVDSGTRDAGPLYHRVALGELPLGQGQIRIVGALLPQPSQRFDHPLGLEPYALTYTGYILAGNLLDWNSPASPPPPPENCKGKKESTGRAKGHNKC